MYSDVKFIPEQIANKIKDTAVMEDVVKDYVVLHPQGTSQVGDCPCCGAKRKFNVSVSKQIWKCWVCDESGKDAVKFLMVTQGMGYVEALVWLAQKYNIPIEEKKEIEVRENPSKVKFRTQQLRDSGISLASQKYMRTEGEKAYEYERYQSASLDKWWNVIEGDDMILNYVDLDFQPIAYKDKQGKRKTLIRVRWSNPHQHKDRNGKPKKYESPVGSGSHLWLPNAFIKAYQRGDKIETLYVTEGEKKADKHTNEGVPTLGIMGIHNFSTGGEMAQMFSMIIKRMEVKRIVFLVDADWDELKAKPFGSVTHRPNTFFSAVRKFRDYFETYRYEGIELKLYFAYGKSKVFKGVDDLLVRAIPDKIEEYKKDLEKALVSADGSGEWTQVHDITTASDYALKRFWHLHSPSAFLHHYREELVKLKEFYFRGLKRRVNEQGEIELAQALLPHEQYWEENEDDKGRVKINFDYYNINIFLKNKGYGLYPLKSGEHIYIHQNGRVVTQVTAHEIQRFVQDFTEQIERYDVLRMLLRGGKQYMGPDKLGNMRFLNPLFVKPDRDTQFLYFKNCYWKITAEGMEQRPLSELPGYVWKDKLLDFEPKQLKKMMCKVERIEDKWRVDISKEAQESDIANYYANTSNFHWKKEQELNEEEEGAEFWQEKEDKDIVLASDLQTWQTHLVSKMVAAGYLMHEYIDWSTMKAVVMMDGLETEVGKSQGGTGKGIFGTQFEHLVPVFWINGKRKNLDDDKHIYAGVDERTQIIWFEDVRINFDFESLFPTITKAVWSDPKGEKAKKEEPKKVLLDTNHALKGEGNSFYRRQYMLCFSDYYNKNRTVKDDFGRQFFREWDWEQWNYFYNWMANCIQVYLKFRLKYGIPRMQVERRKLRQSIGEDFLTWAKGMYGEQGLFLNKRVDKTFACAHFLKGYPQHEKYINVRKFKAKLLKFARYADLQVNPTHGGKRMKSGDVEYITLANDDFVAAAAQVISNDMDYKALKQNMIF